MAIYLYKKTHRATGLKYLGKTVQDPYRYKGSGIWWLNHIKKYGYDVETEIIKECNSKEEVKFWGMHYSILWDIVNSKEWANLKPESGDGGSTPEMWKKISATMKGRLAHNKGKKQKHKPHSVRKDSPSIGASSVLKGVARPKICCIGCQKEVDVANLSRYHSH